MQKNVIALFFSGLLILLLTPWFFNPLQITSYYLDFERLPVNFDGYKIAVIADLHNHRFGKNQKKLIKMVLDQEPDMIVLAGDVIDKHDKIITNTEDFLKGISGKCPIFAIPGNHDYMHPPVFEKLFKLYRKYGVTFLDGDTVPVEKEGQLIVVSSPELKHYEKGDLYSIERSPTPLYKNEFNILLHHYGNEFDILSDEYDLVLTGHVHGGLIRLFGKGLINANKRKPFFPKYSKGIYQKQSGSVMVLSAGLGDAIIPRFNNPREIVIVNLRAK